MLEYFLSFLILTGAIFTFIGSLGLLRLKDFYTRLHGPTKATTLGVGSLLIASSVFFSTRNAGISLHEILITLFLFITAPVSAHLLAKAALHLNLHSLAKSPAKEADEKEAVNTDITKAKETAEKPSSAETPPPKESA
jgi:multicomponent K+:H+ antiporter subunit G